jgi:hypothetical protein
MRNAILLIFMTMLTMSAQIVTFGVKVGVPLTEALPRPFDGNSSLVDTGRWTVGPTMEVSLTHGFSAELDAVYRGYRYVSSYAFSGIVAGVSAVDLSGQNFPSFFSSFRQETKAWDIPVLLKYRFPMRRFKPFLDAGYQLTHESSDITSSLSCIGTPDMCSGSNLLLPFISTAHFSSSNTYHGEVAGAGIEFRHGRIKIAPEIRYNRLNQGIERNHVTALVGFTF